MDKSLLGWILLLGLGFPLLGILLGEAASRLERQQHPLAVGLRQVREYVLPPLAVILVMRQLLSIAGKDSWARFVETLTWVAVIVAGLSLINALLTTKKQPIKWQIHVPSLFFQVARGVVIFAIGYHILNGVWNIDLTGLGSTVGIASAVIALALQDTLSNLVSGLLLLFAKPFRTGDWIEIDGKQGRVIEQNWWSVTMKNPAMTFNVPNGVLSKASIINYGQRGIWKSIYASFSYDDSPSQVISALNTLTEGIDLIEAKDPALVSSYEDSSITYKLSYTVLPEKDWIVAAELKFRLYYITKRYGFTMPYPIQVQYDVEAKLGIPCLIPQVVENRQQELVTYLRSLSYFSTLNDHQIEKLAERARFKAYGKGELIITEGKEDEGLYIIFKGTGHAYLIDEQGERQIVDELELNEAFGEMAIFPGQVSPVTAVADEDVEVVVIPAKEIVQAIESNNKFASEILQYIEERKKMVLLAKGIKDAASSLISHNGRRVQVG
ncbi:small-conductance mechanosensitive channel [Cylindrospermum stagnale PCC 7417]|uniref:Small-conductance mechanosensitive channel n=1 Tax=Cylindrospermum stagnale PCC 7417 TaxID=56107 RepID=K9WTR5_9NOST|nr:cyclic nucleotide-binding domain-containing protein [Cylindrospermum stagnale]AFZ23578.1 small-conductance mechanosensitive channel [Cylindrospermum stagnale PCC 7417]